MAEEKAPWETEASDEVAPWETKAPLEKTMSFGEGLARSTIESLPFAGSLVGGVLGSTLGPIGTVGGAGLGAAAGKSLEQFGKSLFYDEAPESRLEQYKQLGKEGLSGLTSEMGGQASTAALSKAAEYAPKIGTKIGHALTGISEQDIKTYANRAKDIEKLSSESGGDVMNAADEIRKNYQNDISNKVNKINENISNILKKSDAKVNSQSIYDSLEKYKSKLDPSLHIEDLKQIEDIQNRILNASQGGEISVDKANEIKRFLQDKASSSYRNGEIFQIGKEASNAAKGAAAEARSLVDKAEPQVTKLNKTLQQIHEIEDNMNSNLLKKGASESALMTAGSGANVRNARSLQMLGDITETPMLEQAQNLSAMRSFGNPGILPVDTTGKAVSRQGLGSAGGAALGAMIAGPMGAGAGAVAGSALTSPLVLKKTIDVGNKLAPYAKNLLPNQSSTELVSKYLTNKFGKSQFNEDQNIENKSQINKQAIMEKIKGSQYEQVMNKSLQNGGDQSFAAANYVLNNRDPNYRKLFENEN